MKASVRMVCGGCLRSVEVSGASTGTPSNRCPHCDGPIESHLSHVNPPSGETETPPTLTPSLATEIGGPIDWVQTWRTVRWVRLVDFNYVNAWGMAGLARFFEHTTPGLIATSRSRCSKNPIPPKR